mmetsp:Transcript_5587/g.9430  ORF Transcript_5587/g.9430 Transcript_5587/m.9430 type:complete len:334 (+) Transcript_5587:102-1103(+)
MIQLYRLTNNATALARLHRRFGVTTRTAALNLRQQEASFKASARCVVQDDSQESQHTQHNDQHETVPLCSRGHVDGLVTGGEAVQLIHVAFVAVLTAARAERVLRTTRTGQVALGDHVVLPGPIAKLAGLVAGFAVVRDLAEACALVGLRAVAAVVFRAFPASLAVDGRDATRIRLECDHFVFKYRAQLDTRQWISHGLAHRCLAVKSCPALGAGAHIRGSAVSSIGAAEASLRTGCLRQVTTEWIVVTLRAHRHGAIRASPAREAARGSWVHLPEHRAGLHAVATVFGRADSSVETARHSPCDLQVTAQWGVAIVSVVTVRASAHIGADAGA